MLGSHRRPAARRDTFVRARAQKGAGRRRLGRSPTDWRNQGEIGSGSAGTESAH